ncbi:SufD family Fe-S cluster assembly protein [Candidatus Woesebacteria bacterium]|nr:SufD family Fe-S cluster assembly protein [Candidatus Woesebacteria bacterium]
MKTHIHVLEKGHTQEEYVVNDVDNQIFLLYNYSGKLHVKIQKEQAKVYIFGIYVGKGDDNIKIKTIQDHQMGKSLSDLFIRGVFFDNAKFLYEGLITIAKNAQQSNAYQKNQNLLLSKGAFVDSRPFLEIEANDVRCTHGSTTGRIDKEQLYYMNMRGIDNENAQKIIVDGFIEEVFIKIAEISGKSSDIDMLRKKIVQ